MRELKINIKCIGERVIKAVLALAMMACFAFCMRENAAKAADAPSVDVIEIDYDKSTIKVKMDAKDKLLYISTSAQKKWEFVQAAKDENNCITLDISWISVTKDYVLALKGDYSSEPVTVTIPKQIINFKVTYDLFSGTVKEVNNPYDRAVQWRKKEALNWNNYDEELFEDQINTFISNGATIVFRLKPIKGEYDEHHINFDEGQRPSKEFSLTIPKKSAAPDMKVDNEHMTIPVAKGMQYRYVDEDGNPDALHPWSEAATKNEEKTLAVLAPKAMVGGGSTPEDVYIQFRLKATSARQISNVTTIKIPAQKPWTESDSNACSLVYTSSTSFNITISAASATTPYEYCIITKADQNAGVTIDSFEDIEWKQVITKDPNTINKDKEKVENGSFVYVRRAAQKSLGDTEFQLASPEYKLATINYPGDISTGVAGITWLQTVAGACNPSNPSGYLTFTFYSATENAIEEIKFVDATSIGTVRATLKRANGDFTSEVAANAGESDPNKKYIITTKIMNTGALDEYAVNSGSTSRREMLAYIKQKDSTEEFKSTLDKGIGLYIHPATTVDNPSGSTKEADSNAIAELLGWSTYDYDQDKVGFTNSIIRMVDSDRHYAPGVADKAWDASQFRIKLNFGTLYTPIGSTRGEVKDAGHGDEKVAITAIKYDGVTFIPEAGPVSGAACYVEYADTRSKSDIGNESIRTAVLTINADIMEKAAGIDDRNTATPIIIYLNNGEVLKNVLTMNLQESATLESASSWTITEKSLTENDTTTTTSGDTVTTTSKKHIDRTIKLNGYPGLTGVSLTSVTWKGSIVSSDIRQEGSVYTVDLTNSDINKIDVSSTESADLVFTFSNGFKITTGWKLIINPSATN